MHETQFSKSFNSPSISVLGLKLRSYTIGHELALISQGNPIVTYTEKSFSELPSPVINFSLASAVEVCCARIPTIKVLWAIMKMRCNFSEEVRKFREYRSSGSEDFATTRQPRTQGVPFHYFGAPELATLINYVSVNHKMMIDAHFGGTPLNFPLGMAKMLYTTSLECDGLVWVENFQDVEFRERKEAYEKSNPEPGVSVGEDAVKESAKRWNALHTEVKVPES